MYFINEIKPNVVEILHVHYLLKPDYLTKVYQYCSID